MAALNLRQVTDQELVEVEVSKEFAQLADDLKAAHAAKRKLQDELEGAHKLHIALMKRIIELQEQVDVST